METIRLMRIPEQIVKDRVTRDLQMAVFVALNSGLSIEEIRENLAIVCPVDENGQKVDWGSDGKSESTRKEN